jgi:hypothetical protein
VILLEGLKVAVCYTKTAESLQPLIFQAKNGFCRRSCPIVVAGPCPGRTRTASGNVSNFVRIERNNVA